MIETRRQFLRRAAQLAAWAALPWSTVAWAAAGEGRRRKRLVTIFLRGAVDGLSVVVPHREKAYYEGRPGVAIPPPGSPGGALELGDGFGLHPALEPLMPFWREGTLAFVHASGSPDPSRSHFDAQDFMETGTPGKKTTPDGWMNRLLGALPGPGGPTRAVSFGPTMPRIFAGPHSVASQPLGKKAGSGMPLDRPAVGSAFDRLYGGDDALSRAYREGRQARAQLMEELARDMQEADNGAPPPDGFGLEAAQLARLVAKDVGLQLAFLGIGGWDTHVNQGGSEGQLANRLKRLGSGLAAFARGLGPALEDTVVLVLSEFGRTARENGNGGTDHGHGNVLWLLGGPVRGGRILGPWPGLDEEKLFEGRDLQVTTDFRAVVSELLSGHMGLPANAIASVLPNSADRAPLGAIR